MSKLTITIAATTLLLLTGCDGRSVSTSNTNNPDFKVDFLFQHDGCKVYRFNDNGNNHYFTKCTNAESLTSSRLQEGKIFREEEISTK